MDALDNFTNYGHRIWQPRRVQGIFVYSPPTFEERVGHGRLGYRGVYSSVACPWFVKGRKSALDYPMAKVPCPAMHNNQCGSIHRKAGWCTKEPSDGIWYRKRGRDWRTT